MWLINFKLQRWVIYACREPRGPELIIATAREGDEEEAVKARECFHHVLALLFLNVQVCLGECDCMCRAHSANKYIFSLVCLTVNNMLGILTIQ